MEMRTNRERLEGWKEIASYLNRSVRAVQVWEAESGLPVNRLKGRVWAERDELDAWRQTHQVLAEQEEPKSRESPVAAAAVPAEAAPETKQRPVRRRSALAVAIVLILAAGAVGLRMLSRGNPSHVRVDGRTLVALGEDNRELWRFQLPNVPAPYIHGESDPQDYPRSLVTDLDGDGRNEVLYIFNSQSATAVGTTLYCIRPGGSVAWTFQGGKPLVSRSGKEMTGVYHTTVLGSLQRARSDGGVLVVGSQHAYNWPFQVAILTAQGQLVGEYFHPGWLLKLAIADLDGNGSEELLLGGVSGSYGRSQDGDYGPTLVVLDSRRVVGQGPTRPEEGGPAIQGLPLGEEAAVLFFPSPTEHPTEYYRVHRVRTNGEDVELEVRLTNEPAGSPYVIYRLDRKLQLREVLPNHILQNQLISAAGRGPALARLAKVKTLLNRLAP